MKKHTIRNILVVLLIFVVIIVAGVFLILRKLSVSYPEPGSSPEIGKWYTIKPEGTKSSDGSSWHGLMRLGTENKAVIYFYGGGVSLNEEMSQQSSSWFFVPTVAMQDYFVSGGLPVMKEDNPFRNWTFLVVEYSTGDFHCGQGEYHYTDKDGQEKTVYHNGYNNYAAFMESVRPYIGEPDTLLITGSSAGGFATALLADDVMDRIPSAENVTACVDSALLYYDGWEETARHLWKAPEEICAKLHTDNIVLDSLCDLREKRGGDVKILFTCSVRDSALQEYQSYIRTGKMEQSRENSAQFTKDLAVMISDMQTKLPGCGIYLWEYGGDKKTDSTQHMILPGNCFDTLSGDRSPAQWIYDSFGGEVRSYGLELLSGESAVNTGTEG